MDTVRTMRITLASIAALSAMLFAWLVVLVQSGSTMSWDRAVLQSIHAWSAPVADWFFVIITDFGAGVAVVTAGLVAIMFARKGWWRRAITVAASVGGAAFINLLLKLLFQRVRPDLWVSPIVETGFSFPSGHAMISSALLLSLMVVAWSTRWRWLAIIGGGVTIILIGLSRLYLGVHYPTDIMAGWCVGVAWVALVTLIVWWRRSPFVRR